ncbi:MAG: hypothetical protein U0075_07980 [Thermomicrobiales bacterium]
MSLETLGEIQKLGPFGEANPQPILRVRRAPLRDYDDGERAAAPGNQHRNRRVWGERYPLEWGTSLPRTGRTAGRRSGWKSWVQMAGHSPDPDAADGLQDLIAEGRRERLDPETGFAKALSRPYRLSHTSRRRPRFPERWLVLIIFAPLGARAVASVLRLSCAAATASGRAVPANGSILKAEEPVSTRVSSTKRGSDHLVHGRRENELHLFADSRR